MIELSNEDIDIFNSSLVHTIKTIAQDSIPICKSSAGQKNQSPGGMMNAIRLSGLGTTLKEE